MKTAFWLFMAVIYRIAEQMLPQPLCCLIASALIVSLMVDQSSPDTVFPGDMITLEESMLQVLLKKNVHSLPG